MNTTDAYKTTYDAAQFSDGAKDALEALVDKFGLPRGLDLLCNVCEEKAQHLEENWQDKPASKLWRKVGVRIDNESVHVRQYMEDLYGKPCGPSRRSSRSPRR